MISVGGLGVANSSGLMGARRMQAFSDGFFAIIITIMVLSLPQPHGATFAAMRPATASLLAYAMSFLYLGNYWNNHHHLLMTVRKVTGGMLWSNLNMLFWLSLFPFCTLWMSRQHFASQTVATYGVVLTLAGFAYWLLQNAIVASLKPDTSLKEALGKDRKSQTSLIANLASIPLALAWSWGGVIIFAGVALLWLIPDRRLERYLDPQSLPEYPASSATRQSCYIAEPDTPQQPVGCVSLIARGAPSTRLLETADDRSRA